MEANPYQRPGARKPVADLFSRCGNTFLFEGSNVLYLVVFLLLIRFFRVELRR
jgi:hypothetical protein